MPWGSHFLEFYSINFTEKDEKRLALVTAPCEWCSSPSSECVGHNREEAERQLAALGLSFELHGIFVVEFLPSEIYCPTKPMFGVLGHWVPEKPWLYPILILLTFLSVTNCVFPEASGICVFPYSVVMVNPWTLHDTKLLFFEECSKLSFFGSIVFKESLLYLVILLLLS